MGISANHARLLALTARKCDLETQMQVILNTKLNIARQTSDIANDYNEKISDRKLSIFRPASNAPITNGASNDPVESQYQKLDAKNLYNANGLLLAQKSGGAYIEAFATSSGLSPKQIEDGLRDGTYVLVQAATLQTQDPKDITFNSVTYLGGDATTGLDLTGEAFDGVSSKWEIVDWRDSTYIMDQLDKSNDDEAQTNYEKVTNELKEKEAEMDVEMNQIESQHSAISNELESTKKVLTKNTEDSFKYFS